MNVVKLIADSPQDALEKVRDELGVDAVILNVRPVQAGVLKRMWNGKQVEVLATKSTPERSEKEAMLQLATRVGELEEELTARGGTGWEDKTQLLFVTPDGDFDRAQLVEKLRALELVLGFELDVDPEARRGPVRGEQEGGA